MWRVTVSNKRVSVLLAALFLVALPVFGQQLNVGGFNGTVTDTSGAVVPGAQVAVASQTTALQQVTQTNDSGIYSVSLLPVGAYKITVTARGFEGQERTDVQALPGQTFTVDFTLKVGATTQVVTVNAAAPVLDTTSANMGSSQGYTQVQQLPLTLSGSTAREAISVAQTMPGVGYDIKQGQAWTNISRGTINGIPPGQFGYEIDGLYAGAGAAESAEERVSAPPEGVQEIRLTDNTDASAGFNGGVTLSLVTRGGTDQTHGSLYYYGRNQALEARNFFLPTVPQDQQNQWGGIIGGAIKLPYLYTNKNKTYYFVYWNQFRYRFTTLQGNGGTTQVSSVPTAAMKTGDFTSFLGPQIGADAVGRPVYQGEIYDPSTTRQLPNGTFVRDPYSCNGTLNVICSNSASPISVAFQQGYAGPNLPGNTLNWAGAGGENIIDQDELNFRIDELVGEKHRFFFERLRDENWFPPKVHGKNGAYYIFGSSGYLSPELSNGFIDDRDEYEYRFNYTFVAKPTVVFSFRAGVMGSPGRHNGVYPQGPQVGYGKKVGLNGTITGNTPSVNIDGVNGFGLGFEGSAIRDHSIPVSADLSWHKGSHDFKFGVQYLGFNFSFARLQASASGTSGVAGGSGQFNFSRNETGLPGFEPATGNGYASYLTGYVDNANMSTGFDGRDYTAGEALFAQDTWRVTPKVTLSYGLRWEFFTPMISLQDRISSFDPSVPNPKAGDLLGAISFYGKGTGRNGLHDLNPPYFRGFAPKLGVAYSPNPKTVLRANFGIGYLPMQGKYYGGTGQYVQCDGFCFGNITQSLDNGVTPAFNWNTGYPVVFPTTFPITDPSLDNGSGVSFWDRNDNRMPMVENIGVQVGRELPHNIKVEVGYVGTMVHRLYTNYSLNSLPLSDLSLGSLLLSDIRSPEAQAAGIPIPYPSFKGSVAQALLPFPQYTGVTNQQASIGNSTYNAFQVVVQKQVGALSLNANYTASKMLTNANVPGSSSESNLEAQHPSLRNNVKALANGDYPWMLNLSWVYPLPFGTGKRYLGSSSGLVNGFLGNWTLSVIQSYQAGRYIPVSTAVSIPGIGSVWANEVPGQPVQLRPCSSVDPGNPAKAAQLNINAFEDPAPFTLGNTNRLPSSRSCSYLDEDVGMNKDISLSERWKLHFGILVYNIFNRHAFSPSGFQHNIDIPSSFGHYSAILSNPRQLQYFMKLSF
jgi:hypothetical protein